MSQHECVFKISPFTENIRCCMCGFIERKNKGKETWRPIQNPSISWTEDGKKKTKKRHHFIGETFKYKYQKDLECFQSDKNDYSFESLRFYTRGFQTAFKKALMSDDPLANIVITRKYDPKWTENWEELDEEEREEEGGILGMKYPLYYQLKVNLKPKGQAIKPEDFIEVKYKKREFTSYEKRKQKQYDIENDRVGVFSANQTALLPTKKPSLSRTSLPQILVLKIKAYRHIYEEYDATTEFNPDDIYKDDKSYIDYFTEMVKSGMGIDENELRKKHPVPDKLLKKKCGISKPKQKPRPPTPEPEPEEKGPTRRQIHWKELAERKAITQAKIKEEDRTARDNYNGMIKNINKILKSKGWKLEKNGEITDITK